MIGGDEPPLFTSCMASCFDDLISIRSACSASAGTGSFFIEDIGITIDECDQYINSEYSSGLDFVKDKLRLATDLVKKNIANHFSDSIISKSLVDSNLLGQYQDSLQLKLGAIDTLGGISVTLFNTNSYFDFYINNISLQVSVTQVIDVFVYDLISGMILDTIPVNCVANTISTAFVNKSYSSFKRKLDIILVYDTEGISSNTTALTYAGCSNCNGYNYSTNYLTSAGVTILESATKIRSSLATTMHTSGLSINYSIQCSPENWLCEISNLMVLPILYTFGVEVMNYACFYSNRQTSSVNIDSERNKERLQIYQNELNTSFEATIKKINIPKYDPCFKCEEYIRNKIVLP